MSETGARRNLEWVPEVDLVFDRDCPHADEARWLRPACHQHGGSGRATPPILRLRYEVSAHPQSSLRGLT